MPTILVTNDDGVSSQGIRVLSDVLKSLGDVYVVAPETEQKQGRASSFLVSSFCP